jgi:hypothetical protein
LKLTFAPTLDPTDVSANFSARSPPAVVHVELLLRVTHDA